MTSFKRWRVQLLGGLRITSSDQIITRFRSRTTGSLFAYLAYHNGRPQPREVLIDRFWPDADSKKGRNLLSVSLYSLRSQLGAPDSGSDILVADSFNVALNPDLFETDVADFQNALKRARRASNSLERLTLLEEAINYYGGDLLVGFYDSWLIPEQVQLREQFEQARAELEPLTDDVVNASTLSDRTQDDLLSKTLPTIAPADNYSVLPLTFTRFFGRQHELDRLDELLPPSPQPNLITLTGIGGIGKTRLAREAAQRLQSAYHGRTWFVALAEIKNANRILDTIRETLRLPADPTGDPLTQVCAFLRSAPSLLILDNMEQFVTEGRAAIILQTLRVQVPSLCCVVTSRQLLGVDGERAFPVGPLLGSAIDEDTCLRLFEDRARAVRPSFRVVDTNEATIRKLCAVLDGIPLAIELAAARIGLLSPAQMLSQMNLRFVVLHSRRRDIPKRHQSLWAAIDSSYQLLPDPLKRVFARLSVFRGGWTIESAQAICLDITYPDSQGGEALQATLECMGELLEASLIYSSEMNGGDSRFQMLDTLREFALEQLKKIGDDEKTLQRHADFFADLATKAETHLAIGTTDSQWLDKLDNDVENIRLMMDTGAVPANVLRIATALHRFWLIRGHVTEGRNYLHAAISMCSSNVNVSFSEMATAHNALGVLASSSGALDDAREHFELSLHHYTEDKNLIFVARALNNIGIVAMQSGDFATARNYFERSQSLYASLGDSLRQSITLSNLGAVLVHMEDYAAARQALEECLPIQQAAQDNFALLRTLHNLAEVALRQGDLDSAESWLFESLPIRRASGEQSWFDDVLVTISMVLGKRNRTEEACVVWAAAQSLRTQSNTVTSPANEIDENRWIEEMYQTLPEVVVEEMQRKGREMNFDKAITYVEDLLSQTR